MMRASGAIHKPAPQQDLGLVRALLGSYLPEGALPSVSQITHAVSVKPLGTDQYKTFTLTGDRRGD